MPTAADVHIGPESSNTWDTYETLDPPQPLLALLVGGCSTLPGAVTLTAGARQVEFVVAGQGAGRAEGHPQLPVWPLQQVAVSRTEIGGVDFWRFTRLAGLHTREPDATLSYDRHVAA